MHEPSNYLGHFSRHLSWKERIRSLEKRRAKYTETYSHKDTGLCIKVQWGVALV